MPRVPVEENRVGIAEVTGAKLQAGDLSGTGLQALGGGFQALGRAGGDYAEQQQRNADIYDDAAVKQGWNAYAERSRAVLRTGEGAFYSQSGFNAGNALKPTEAALTKIRDEVRATLKTDRQRDLYDRSIGERLGVDLSGIYQHATGQLKVEQNRQAESVRVNSANDALDHENDPVMFGEFVRTGVKAIEAQAEAQGWAPEFVAREKAAYVSGIHTNVVDRKMIADPVAAAAYQQKHLDEILPGDSAKIERALYGPMVERAAEAIVDGYPGAVANVTPAVPQAGASVGGVSVTARMIAITAHSESGNRETDSRGRRVTSPAGAQGIMQVMPGTQRDPGFGVRKSNGTPEDDARVGRDYLAAMTKRYGGDPAKAWGAYNAGPGAVDNAVKKGGDNWLGHMPKETQGYVRKNVAMLGPKAPGDTGAEFAPRREDLNGIYQYIQSQNLPYDVEKAALAAADKRVARNDRLLDRQQDDAYDQALGVVTGLGEGFTSVNQIPGSVRNRLSPEALHSLTAQASNNARPKQPEANSEAIQTLHEAQRLNPQSLLRPGVIEGYVGKITPAEMDEMKSWRAEALTKPREGPKQVSLSAITGYIGNRGPDIGVDMSARKKGEDEKAFKVRRAEGYNLQRMMTYYVNNLTQGKRPPTQQDLDAAFANAVMPIVSGGKAVERFRATDLPTNSVAMPESEHRRIKKLLRANGMADDEASVARYYMLQTRPK